MTKDGLKAILQASKGKFTTPGIEEREIACNVGVIASNFGVIACNFGVIACNFGVIACNFGVIAYNFGVIACNVDDEDTEILDGLLMLVDEL
jgi:hypothetical protein